MNETLKNTEVQSNQHVHLPQQLQTYLTEYQGLREEILERSKTQRIIIVFALTAIGAVVSLTIQQQRPELLLAIPLILPFVLVIWCEHHHSIMKIGEYLDDHIAQKVQNLVLDEDVLSWSKFRKTPHTNTSHLLSLSMWIWLFCLFGFIPTVTIVVTSPLVMPKGLPGSMPSWITVVLWCCTLASTTWSWFLLVETRRSRTIGR